MIGGWSTSGVGQSYGSGYNLQVKHEWLNKIQLKALGQGNYIQGIQTLNHGPRTVLVRSERGVMPNKRNGLV